MLIVSLVLSCVLLVNVNITPDWKKSIPSSLVWCFLGLLGVGVCAVMLPAVLLQMLLTFAGGFVCAWVAPRPRPFFLTKVAAFFLAYLVTGGYAWFDIIEMQRQTAPVSMARRLAYENRRPNPVLSSLPHDIHLISLGTPAKESFDEGVRAELGENSRKYRADRLKALHEHQIQMFVSSPGFGVGRFNLMGFHDFRSPEPPPTPMNEPASFIPAESEASLLVGGATSINDPTSSHLERFHTSSTLDFVHREGFGYIKDRQTVYGFRPHRISQLPETITSSGGWRFRTLELVSLLKHERPAVYLSKNLPRMSELRDAPTRDLNAFETVALPKLQSGDSLVVHLTAERLRVLGAVRAGGECLSCHEGKKGDLLGAFSYRFDRYGRIDR